MKPSIRIVTDRSGCALLAPSQNGTIESEIQRRPQQLQPSPHFSRTFTFSPDATSVIRPPDFASQLSSEHAPGRAGSVLYSVFATTTQSIVLHVRLLGGVAPNTAPYYRRLISLVGTVQDCGCSWFRRKTRDPELGGGGLGASVDVAARGRIHDVHRVVTPRCGCGRHIQTLSARAVAILCAAEQRRSPIHWSYVFDTAPTPVWNFEDRLRDRTVHFNALSLWPSLSTAAR